MRIAVMGTGSLGGLYGGRLARAGCDVTFIARGATLAALQNAGLTVKSNSSGDYNIPVIATSDPSTVGPVDLIILATKRYDLEAAVEQLKPLVHDETIVLTLQNGIDAASQVNRILEGDHALTGVAYVNASLEAPGVVREITANDYIELGEAQGGKSDRVGRLQSLLTSAGIDARPSEDVRVPMWEKFILLAGTGGVMALTRQPIGAIRESEVMSEFFLGTVREAEAVGRALGIEMAPDIVDRHWKLMETIPGESRSSMLQDLVNGRRLELEALNGAVVQMGRELGVPVHLNFAVYAGLVAYVSGSPSQN